MARLSKNIPTKLEPAFLLIDNKKIPIKHYYENIMINTINNGGARISLSAKDAGSKAYVFIIKRGMSQ